MLHQAIPRKIVQINKLTLLTFQNLGCTLPTLPKMYPLDQVVPIQPSKFNLLPTPSIQISPTKQIRHISPEFLANHRSPQQRADQPMFQAGRFHPVILISVQNLLTNLILPKLCYLSPVHCRSALCQTILNLRHLNRLSRMTS